MCDARPAKFSSKKIKKNGFDRIDLVKNPDILKELSKKKKKGQVFIGFALESDNAHKNAQAKLRQKGLDMIVLQEISIKKDPFGLQNVKASFFRASGMIRSYPKISKSSLSHKIIREIPA